MSACARHPTSRELRASCLLRATFQALAKLEVSFAVSLCSFVLVELVTRLSKWLRALSTPAKCVEYRDTQTLRSPCTLFEGCTRGCRVLLDLCNHTKCNVRVLCTSSRRRTRAHPQCEPPLLPPRWFSLVVACFTSPNGCLLVHLIIVSPRRCGDDSEASPRGRAGGHARQDCRGAGGSRQNPLPGHQRDVQLQEGDGSSSANSHCMCSSQSRARAGISSAIRGTPLKATVDTRST